MVVAHTLLWRLWVVIHLTFAQLRRDVTEEEFADNSPVKCRTSKQRNCRTKRDREPSRIPVNKLLRKFKNKRLRANFKYQFMNSVPNTSFIMNFCKNYNKVSFWCRSEQYYSKYVFFMKINKSKLGFKSNIYSENLCSSVIDSMQNRCIAGNYCNNCLKGGLFPGDVSRRLSLGLLKWKTCKFKPNSVWCWWQWWLPHLLVKQ